MSDIETCNKMKRWMDHFIQMAKLVSSMSKDPNHKIGAVIVNQDNRIISMGFNGFAKGVEDSQDRLNNKEVKRALMLHAEENAILQALAGKQDLTNCDIYVFGYPPCVHCTSLIIQSGIKHVYFRFPDKKRKISDAWKQSFKLAEEIAKEVNLIIKEI